MQALYFIAWAAAGVQGLFYSSQCFVDWLGGDEPESNSFGVVLCAGAAAACFYIAFHPR